jgi:hypothetical protein
MKIQNYYLTIIQLIVLLSYLNIQSSSLNKQLSNQSLMNDNNNNLNSKMQGSIPMISENELREIMQNAVEEYKRLSEEEKELMSQQIGIKIEELDEIMNEASAFVDEINANNKKNDNSSNKKFEENTFGTNNTEKSSNTLKKNIETKNEIKEYILIFEKTVKTLETLNLKISDPFIREKIITELPMILNIIEKTIYYLLIIKQFLLNNENQVIIQKTDINILINIANKINNLKDSIEKLITSTEYESANNRNDLFEKYSIKKKSNTDLKTFLENEITTLKNKIKEIESEVTQDSQSKKEKSKKIINIEYKIDILEKDLTELETSILETQKNDNQFSKYQKLLNEVLDKIIKNLKNIFITDNASTEIEEIIRKYFPEEYKIGKQKEEQIKKQIANEKKIKEQKGSNNEMYIEKNIKNSPIDTKTKSNENSETNNFQATNNNYDYEDDGNQEEQQSPFDFPKNLGTDKQQKENKNTPEKEIKDLESNNKEKEKKKYNDLRHKNIKDKEKEDKEDKEDKNKDKIKGLDNIENQLKDIYILIENFTKEHTGSLYTQWKSEAFAQELEKELTELQIAFSTINSETIKVKGKKNIFLNTENKKKETEKVFIEPNINNKTYLNEELEKIEWTETKLTSEPLPQAQLIMYQIKEINEILITTFKNKGRREEKDLHKVFPLLENIMNEYKKLCVQGLNTTTLPYWLLTKDDIEKQIADKKNKKKESTEKPLEA